MKLKNIIEDVYINGENTKYIKEVQNNYPYILGWLKNTNMKFNEKVEIVEKIGNALRKTDNYCPCEITRTDDTICPCKKMREDNECICGLYVRK